MSDPFRSKSKKNWTAAGSGTTLVYTPSAGEIVGLESLDVEGDTGTLTVTFGSTDVIALDFGASAYVYAKTFPPGVYQGAPGEALTITVTATGRKLNCTTCSPRALQGYT